jgi:gamma-glutamyltranspeptidase/glutathione hydrolase
MARKALGNVIRNFEDPGRSLAIARHGTAATSHPASTLTADLHKISRPHHECPPNGQRVVAVLILNILSRFSLSNDPFDADDLHLLLEAIRLAYAAPDPMVADPSGSNGAVERMLSSDLIASQLPSPSIESFDTVEHTILSICAWWIATATPSASSIRYSVLWEWADEATLRRVVPQTWPELFTCGRAPQRSRPTKAPDAYNMAAEGRARHPCHLVLWAATTRPWAMLIFYHGSMIAVSIFRPPLTCRASFRCPPPRPWKPKRPSAPVSALNWNAAASRFSRPGWPSAAHKPFGLTGSAAVLIGGSDPRKDGMALGYCFAASASSKHQRRLIRPPLHPDCLRRAEWNQPDPHVFDPRSEQRLGHGI